MAMLQRSSVVLVALLAIGGVAVVESKPVPAGMMDDLVMAELTTAIPKWAGDGGVFKLDVGSLEKFPVAYRGIVPEFTPVFEFVDSLTADEKALLKKGIHVKDWEELSDLEPDHPALYAKLTKLGKAVKAKFASLHPDAQAFLEKIGNYMMAHCKELLSATEQPNFNNPLEPYSALCRYVVEEYSKLSEAAKASLRQEFPGVMAIAESSVMKLFYNEVSNRPGRMGGLRIGA